MRWAAKLPLRFPKTIIIISILLTVAAVFFLPRLHVSTDRNILAGTTNPEFQRRDEVNRLFGTSLVAIVVLSGTFDSEEVKRAADELAEALSKHKDMIRDVFYKADISFFESHALLFMPVEKLRQLPELLNRTDEAVDLLQEAENLPSLLNGIAELIQQIPPPKKSDEKEAASALHYFEEAIEDLKNWFQNPRVKRLTLGDTLWSAGPSMNSNPGNEGYLTDRDGKNPPLAVLFIQPANPSQAMEVVEPLTDLLRKETATVLKRFPGLRSQVTGMPAIVTDEMRLVTRDSIVAGIASGLGVFLVFMLAFRSFRVSLFLVFPLGVGLIWSAALTAILYGHLTLITSYFAAVLFGLGVAFTIHIVARYHESLLAGQTKEEAIETALAKAGPGVVAGGGTTALAFLAIAFSDFKGFAEMGVVSGSGVTLILLANLTLLPAALLLWHPGKDVVRANDHKGSFWVKVSQSRIVVPLLAFVGLVAGIVLSPKVEFDYAVESMLPSKAESVVGMRTLDKRTEFSMNYSIALANTLEEAEELRRKFEKLSTVSRAEALSMFLPPDQKERLAAIENVSEELREKIDNLAGILNERVGHVGLSTRQDLADSITNFADTVEDLAFDAKRAGRQGAETLDRIVKKTRELSDIVLSNQDDSRVQKLETTVFQGLARGIRVLKTALHDKGFSQKDLPIAVTRRYLSKDNKHYGVVIFPNGDIGEKEFFEKHVAELLSVSPDTTGHPVTHLTFTKMVHAGFKNAVILAAIAVLILILFDLRSPRGLVLGVLPVLMGLGWTIALMVLTGFKFNYANLMALPILIGTGVDYGVHLAHRAKQEGSILRAVETTGQAIALTGLTTLIGFGSLLLGNHFGVRSLGIILVTGITSSIIAALVVIPGFMRGKKRNNNQ